MDMPLIGLHVPKSAGMSLIELARAHIPSNRLLELSNAVAPFADNRFVSWYDVRNPWKLALIFGHNIHEEMIKFFRNKPFLFTILRHPVDRLESQYFFDRELAKKIGYPAVDMDQFLNWNSDSMCNFVARRFPSAAAKCKSGAADVAVSILEVFDRVYFYDDFSEQLQELCAMLGIPAELPSTNVRSHGLRLDPQDRTKFERHCEKDMEAFERTRTLFAPEVAAERKARSGSLGERRAAVWGAAYSDAKLKRFMARYVVKEFRHWNRLQDYCSFREAQQEATAEELRLLREQPGSPATSANEASAAAT